MSITSEFWQPQGPKAEGMGGINGLVDRLLNSLEDILASPEYLENGERRTRPQARSASSAQRLQALCQRVESLEPQARTVMRRVVGEVTAQLDEIRQLGNALQTAVRDSDEARRLAEEYASTDPLTGLLNRRGFSEQARRAYAQATACKQSVLLMFVDIDGMKQINDRGGHQAGDRAIQVAAEALRRSFRNHDLLVRWGGDEFTILSVGNPVDIASMRERVRRHADLVRAEHAIEGDVRLSIGAVQRVPEDDCSLDELMLRADDAMYQAKRERKLCA